MVLDLGPCLVLEELMVRFRPSVVKECIHAVLKEELANAEYSPEEMPQLTKRLSETIKDKLKEMGFDRYKMVVQVVIGEQRGEGVFMAARCFWDADTDNYTHDVFMNVSLFGSLFFLSKDMWTFQVKLILLRYKATSVLDPTWVRNNRNEGLGPATGHHRAGLTDRNSPYVTKQGKVGAVVKRPQADGSPAEGVRATCPAPDAGDGDEKAGEDRPSPGRLARSWGATGLTHLD
uniref:tctex1 domain-containing protein 2 n=1 Tax=Odobenus rosmarus divergens TaxID=9708 RepID=UPI00063C7B04|nr:PREDICTED: tctex1 domain-containing protein 2 [Odobenus rosmarus divergens]